MMNVSPIPQDTRPSQWTRGFPSLKREHAFEPLRVEGTIPRDLVGTLYRNGPGLFERFGDRYRHWFDGDGAITAIRLERGTARGAVRIVRTQAFQREER